MSAGRLWSSLLLLLPLFCSKSSSCGLSTHVEIGHRALEFLRLQDGRINYKELILEHQDAYQAGTVFPDAFYPSICKRGKYHDVSERTHWTPFLNASIHYIRENYPLPWEKDTEKLVAFLFGITSHMVADLSWHNLGFLRTMGAIDFYNSYSDAHSAGDFGGDVLSQFEFNFNYLSRRWYVPVRDLLRIYDNLYGRKVITKDVLVDCTYLQFLEMHGEMFAVSKLYSTYSTKSPFLVEQFQDYFLGGLDDMAFWSTNIYRLTSFMLENGTSDCNLPENPLFISCDGRNHTLSGSKVQKNDFHRNLTMFISRDIRKNLNYTERGVFYSTGSWARPESVTFMYQTLERNLRLMLAGSSQKNLNHVSSPSASYTLSVPYARLGWVMTSADLNQDGHGDLVVGAPGYSHPGRFQIGRVYIIYGNDLGLPPIDLDLNKEGILEGFQPSGRFGSALAVLDFNQDGLPDLAVGAPSVGSGQLTYNGSVYVYYGSQQGRLSSSPNVTISCKDTYCNLGWTLLATDADGDGRHDLVISSPFAPGGRKQKGIVATFYSHPRRNDKELLTLEEADWKVNGEEDFSWFGYSLHGVTVANRSLLLIGSPTWKNVSRMARSSHKKNQEEKSLGKVYGYFLPNRQSTITISGDKAMGKLGTSLSSGYVRVNGTLTQVLLVGAPTHDDVSKMAFLTMTLHQGGATRMYELAPEKTQPALLSTFSGDRRFSRFGSVLHLTDLDDDGLDEIIMAAPLRITDVTSGLLGGEDGRVYIYNGMYTTLGDMTGKCKSWMTPCPEEKAQYVLTSPEASSRFGSSLVSVRSKGRNQVVVAAGRSSWGARLSGALHVYSFSSD
uniref:Phosphatidylinositol-glycan-specific phospholipase D n=1 Tax=Mus musculus TaxID=10090 RepID=PHLD_MOUSE|nr:RecName: Full=Phosphatidylinositol-glycan-specific phospholipase D; Short=PI-G PLD; AltName: Full=Glycoprotein phospholipase D; AltName: Full=Glycosyl-phosphatidylinositol-specific phospholipase D; Short=GPI-PLD; Short=GPI-specific phospholipase D; Flags: Precursor [Mus musculus]AAC77799.1 glycosylphosphatidylinositol-specific phospholipase D precursor [Mus musculus]